MFRIDSILQRCPFPSGRTLIPVVIGLCILIGNASDARPEPAVIDRVTAVVNDEVISLFELNQEMIPYLERMKSLGYSPEQEAAARYKLREDVLNQLIDQKLTDQEIKRLNITVSTKEVDDAVERVKQRGFQTEEALVEALKSQGMTLEDYRMRMREQILRSKLVNIEVKSKIVITKDDIAQYYAAHGDEYRFEKKYHLRNILLTVPPMADETEKNAVEKKILFIRSEVMAGKSFADLAKQYSEAPTAENGGFLGEFELKDLNQVLQDALKDMKAHDVTNVVVSDQGYQLFYVEEISKSPGRSLEEASAEIEEKLYGEIVNKEFQSWLSALREKSVIRIIR